MMRAIFFAFTLLLSTSAFCQFGDLMNKVKKDAGKIGKDKLKDKAKDVNKEGNKEIDGALTEAEKDYDETSLKYAIAFVDNAGLFEVKEKFLNHKKAMKSVMPKDVDFFHLGKSFRSAGNNVKNTDDRVKDNSKDKATESVTDPVTYIRTGEIAYASTKYNVAEFQFKRAQNLLDGKKTSDEYMRAESDLGLVYHTQGRLTESLERTNNALKLREERKNGSPEHAVSLNNKAVLLKDMSEYLDAEKLIDQAVQINKEKFGANSLQYAITLNNKAMIYHELGRYKEAETLMKECLGAAQKSLGGKSANYVRLKINLAMVYRDNGRLKDAEEIYKEAITIKEKRLGKKHPDYAHLKRGLAALYTEMGEEEKAEPLLEEASQIYLKQFGEKHPSYATTLFELGHLKRVKGELTKAEELLKQSLKIRDESLGKKHPEHTNTIEEIALVKWQQGKMSEANSMYEEVMTTSSKFLDDYFPSMSEKEKMRFWDKFRVRMNKYYSLLNVQASSNPAFQVKMLDLHLKTKGLLLNSTNRIKQLLLTENDPELQLMYREWLDKKENLARVYSYSKKELEEEKIDLEALEKEANDLERKISSKSSEFQNAYALESITNSDITSSLKSDQAVVEIMEFKEFNKTFTGNNIYAYFIMKSGQKVGYMTKSDGKKMDSKSSKFYKNAIKYGIDDNKSYEAYWKGVDALVSDKQKVFISLDGVYNQINLNTLKLPSGNNLLEEKQLIYVTHSKDVKSINQGSSASGSGSATLIGNPDYGNGKAIALLPGTKKEISSIQSIISSRYKTKVYTEQNANETNVKSASSTIVHFACHGFFLSDVKKSKGPRTLGVESSKAAENPLLRSGLMLSGAHNVFDTNKVNHSTTDNGILTAFEVMNMNLSNTDLVVLSACETGLGDIKVGEGVYGLQRAFQVAGAKALIMSLWKVDDAATQKLMTTFYSNLKNGLKKEEAFRKAQLTLKASYSDPKYWGAFRLIESQ